MGNLWQTILEHMHTLAPIHLKKLDTEMPIIIISSFIQFISFILTIPQHCRRLLYPVDCDFNYLPT